MIYWNDKIKKILFFFFLLSWHKSTLLLKNKCFGTAVYMKTQCLQTNEMHHWLGKESALGAGGGVEKSGTN